MDNALLRRIVAYFGQCSNGIAHIQKRQHMEVVVPRYETFPDPINNWIIWDLERDDIAKFDGEFLVLGTEEEAAALCDFLNDTEARRAA